MLGHDNEYKNYEQRLFNKEKTTTKKHINAKCKFFQFQKNRIAQASDNQNIQEFTILQYTKLYISTCRVFIYTITNKLCPEF